MKLTNNRPETHKKKVLKDTHNSLHPTGQTTRITKESLMKKTT